MQLPSQHEEYHTHHSINIISDNNFTDYRFPGSGTSEDPYIIEGYRIENENKYGIQINSTTKHFIIRNCHVNALYFCIFISDVAEGTAVIIENTCTQTVVGIFLNSTSGSTLINNTCYSFSYGIYLRNSSSSILSNNICSHSHGIGIHLIYSPGSILINNTCNDNFCGALGNVLTGVGIFLNSSDSILINNTCNDNYDSGIYLENTSSTLNNNTCYNNNFGIFLIDSSFSTLTNNYFKKNEHGIYLISSLSCKIIFNLILETYRYGINLKSDSKNNIIHHNTFEDNNFEGDSQAYDDGLNNTWYDVSRNEGNCWLDWSGIGNYSIDGIAHSVDPFPLKCIIITEEPNNLSMIIVLLLLGLVSKIFFLINRKKKNS